MTFIAILSAAILTAIFSPSLRCLVKRLICARKLTVFCREKGFHLYPTHRFWFFGHRRGKGSDCYIETPGEIFAIKFFGVPHRRHTLIFTSRDTYCFRSFLTLMGLANFHFDGKPHPLPPYRFRLHYRDEWELKTPHHILLINPIPVDIRRCALNGTEEILGAGDTVRGMEIQSLSRLLGRLEAAL